MWRYSWRRINTSQTGRGGSRGGRSIPKDDFIDYGSDSFDEPKKPTPRGRGRGGTKRPRAQDYDDLDSDEETPTKLAKRGRGSRGRARGTGTRGRGTGTRGRGRGASPGRGRGRGRGNSRGRGGLRKSDFLDDDEDFMAEEEGTEISRRSSRNAGKRKSYSQTHEDDEE